MALPAALCQSRRRPLVVGVAAAAEMPFPAQGHVMRFPRLFAEPPPLDVAHALYVALVEQARQPAFYRDWQVPDSLDGRFEMIALHGFLVLRRLKPEGEAGKLLGQTLFDTIFADLDNQLREMGVGDLGVGKRIKVMAKAFYGRIAAYDSALAASDTALEEALRRNLYGTVQPAPAALAAMAGYLRANASALEACPAAEIHRGRLKFTDAPKP